MFNKLISFTPQKSVIFASKSHRIMKNRDIIKLRVREILAERNMTCRQLAELTGKAPQYINAVLNSHRGLSLNSLIMIAEALEVDFVDLFARASDAKSTQPAPRQGSAIELTKRTLERALRFPDNTDMRLVTELMANLARCMSPDDWAAYRNDILDGLLPADLSPDYDHLATFMSPTELETFRAAMA